MPTCIVPGCTSGYVSNPEKVHFFTIPKDPDRVKLWKIAVRRTDNFIKAGSTVCENHFRKSEILWKRELLGPHGQVLGVSNYMIPRLKKGCVPSQFPWTEYTESDDVELENLSSQDNLAIDVPATKESSPSISDRIILVEQENPETMNCSTFKFKDILDANLNLPTGWSRYVTGCEGEQLVFFFIHHTVKIEDMFQTSILKDVTIKENLSIQIRVLGQHIDPTCLKLSSVLKDTEQLENLLAKIHRFGVCRGCSEPPIKPGLEQLDFKAVRKDTSGTWRHTECPLLISMKKICGHCTGAKKNLETSFRRYVQSKAKERRKKKKNMTNDKKQLERLQSKYRECLKYV